ncbi:MAG: hypothetical protein ACK4F7_04210 [Inhella sp.]
MKLLTRLLPWLPRWGRAVAPGLIAVALLAACQSLSLQPQLPEALSASPALAVSGRHGWLPDRQALRFGAHSTGPRRLRQQWEQRQCPAGCSRFDLGVFAAEFDSRFSRARSRLQFTQEGEGAAPLAVEAVLVEEREEREWSWRVFGKTLHGGQGRELVHPYTGTLLPLSGDAPAWRFIVGEQQGMDTAVWLGWAESEAGQRIELRSLLSWTVRPGGGGLALPAGYLLESEGRAVAAVQLLGGGEVWFAPDLEPSLRQASAALISSLLLRPRR